MTNKVFHVYVTIVHSVPEAEKYYKYTEMPLEMDSQHPLGEIKPSCIHQNHAGFVPICSRVAVRKLSQSGSTCRP